MKVKQNQDFYHDRNPLSAPAQFQGVSSDLDGERDPLLKLDKNISLAVISSLVLHTTKLFLYRFVLTSIDFDLLMSYRGTLEPETACPKYLDTLAWIRGEHAG